MTPIEIEGADPRVALRSLANQRFPLAVLAILALFVGALPVEVFYFPERQSAYLFILGLQFGVSSMALLLARVWPLHARTVITAWLWSIAALVASYCPLVDGDATVAMAAFICLLVAVPALLPFRLCHHAAVCLGCWVGLAGLYLLGNPSSLPWAYVAIIFLAVSALTSVGVASMDGYRFDGIRREKELERAKAELQSALGRAESAVAQRSRLIADVSHEVRTPLSVILGYADMLLDEAASPEERVELVRRIRDYGLSLDALVSRLLDLSRLSTGRLEIARDRVDVARLVDELASGARLLVRGKNVRVEARWVGGIIVTDGLRLRQILRNLITNAARATERGIISLSVECRGGRWRFEVADTGCGIAEERQEEIFTAFEQFGDRVNGGVGLGLAIVRQLADVLGGDVSVQSRPGRGSVFAVELPSEMGAPALPERRRAAAVA